MVCIDWPIMRRSVITFIFFYSFCWWCSQMSDVTFCCPGGGAVVELAGAARQADGSDVVGVADGAAKLHQGNVALCAHFLLTTI